MAPSLGVAGLPSIDSILPRLRGSVDAATKQSSHTINGREHEWAAEQGAPQPLQALLHAEEQRTRQETLKLEQRRLESTMLKDAIHAGVPAHLVPLVFAGGDAANVQAYAALLQHGDQEAASHVPQYVPDRPGSQSAQRRSLAPSPLASQPHHLLRARATSVVGLPHRDAARDRSYPFHSHGPTSFSTDLAPIRTGPPLHPPRPSISLGPVLTRPDYQTSHGGRPQQVNGNGAGADGRLSLAAANNNARSLSVSDASYARSEDRAQGTATSHPRSINFCHWKPPAGPAKHTGKSPRDGPRPSIQLPPVQERTEDGAQARRQSRAQPSAAGVALGKRKGSDGPCAGDAGSAKRSKARMPQSKTRRLRCSPRHD
ncbi:hypothetical protein KEM52_000818 [Ascosphaera acerosa]|nr:hypothetical protein KEM52_000818 [Ascosphaera acerosa]